MQPTETRYHFRYLPQELRFATVCLDLLQDLQNLVGFSRVHYRHIHDNPGNHKQAPNSSEGILHQEPPRRLEVWFPRPVEVYTDTHAPVCQ